MVGNISINVNADALTVLRIAYDVVLSSGKIDNTFGTPLIDEYLLFARASMKVYLGRGAFATMLKLNQYRKVLVL